MNWQRDWSGAYAALKAARPDLSQIFLETYRELRPGAELPELAVHFYRYASLKHTVRLQRGKLRIRLSDLVQGAPENVLRALAHILLAKIYRQRPERALLLRYRKYASGWELSRQAHVVRQIRGRKRLTAARGEFYDLDEVFDALNRRFFHGLMGRPQMSWSQDGARRLLGHYDPAHNAIVISRVFDQAFVPRSAVEYIVYHEMLHLRHPVKMKAGRRCVHSAEFREEEKRFPRLDVAQQFLKRLAGREE